MELFRHRRTVESYQQELKEKAAAVERCEEEKARLRATEGAADGLTGLLSAGVLDKKGIAALEFMEAVTARPGNALSVEAGESYRAQTRVALRLRLKPPATGAPWVALEAVLVGPGGRKGPVLRLRQQAPLTPGGEDVEVILEAEALPREARGPFTLKLWEAGGQRSVVLEGVRFPDPVARQ